MKRPVAHLPFQTYHAHRSRLMNTTAINSELLEFTQRYVMELEFKAEHNGGSLTMAEWEHLKNAKAAIAKATA